MVRLLIAIVAIGAILWSWDQLFGGRVGCGVIAYPARCQGAVIGNRCHGELADALPRRRFLVDPGAQRVTEAGEQTSGAHPRCRVTDCRQWECLDEVFVRTAREGEFREQLRPGLISVDPRRTLSVVYVPAWKWWQLRAWALGERAVAAIRQRV
jgi:hypothetical protein